MEYSHPRDLSRSSRIGTGINIRLLKRIKVSTRVEGRANGYSA